MAKLVFTPMIGLAVVGGPGYGRRLRRYEPDA